MERTRLSEAIVHLVGAMIIEAQIPIEHTRTLEYYAALTENANVELEAALEEFKKKCQES